MIVRGFHPATGSAQGRLLTLTPTDIDGRTAFRDLRVEPAVMRPTRAVTSCTRRWYTRSAARGLETRVSPVRRRSAITAVIGVLAVVSTLAAPARTQTAVTPRPTSRPLFTTGDAYLGGAFAIAALATSPLDRRLATTLQDPALQGNRLLSHSATAFRLAAIPGAFLIGGTLYGVGRLAHEPRTAGLGLYSTEALLLRGATTEIVKVIVGRARPSVVHDTVPGDFRLGRGLSHGNSYVSMPSEHTAVAFALAAAVTSETSRWSARRSTWYVAPLVYGGATMVGLSRLYDDQHWATDIILGAAIGTFSGLKIVRWNHTHPNNRLNRWLLGERGRPTGGGRTIAFALPWP